MRPIALVLFLLTASSCSRRDSASEQARLESEFEKMLSGATLVGRFSSFKSDQLRQERYTVGKVSRLAGDTWIINARIQYGENDYTVPVPVTVLWAGDTPVITLTDVGLPGRGKFTARVLFYRGQYAGTWSNDKGSGGEMFGKIER
ncbi:MAG: hypothetical protein FJW39_13195 [Acidobacteria bacterium]|nr:hypothetical protein [Acidobacteriota bacterium]